MAVTCFNARPMVCTAQDHWTDFAHALYLGSPVDPPARVQNSHSTARNPDSWAPKVRWVAGRVLVPTVRVHDRSLSSVPVAPNEDRRNP